LKEKNDKPATLYPVGNIAENFNTIEYSGGTGNLRLQQARKILLGSTNSISAIAKQVGYDDPTQFTKYFKKNLGCSPREFRQSFKGHNAS